MTVVFCVNGIESERLLGRIGHLFLEHVCVCVQRYMYVQCACVFELVGNKEYSVFQYTEVITYDSVYLLMCADLAALTHKDDEYAWFGVEDPKVVVTTSHSPSSTLKQFA